VTVKHRKELFLMWIFRTWYMVYSMMKRYISSTTLWKLNPSMWRPITSEEVHRNDPCAIIGYKTSGFIYRMMMYLHSLDPGECDPKNICPLLIILNIEKNVKIFIASCVLHQLGPHKAHSIRYPTKGECLETMWNNS
jgi:hypothetical protein